MTHDEAPLARLLAHLPAAVADPGRAARVQARCHQTLARRVRRQEPRRERPVESLVVVALCLAYLFVVIQQALH